MKVVITSGASGIGKSIAQAFDEAGYGVWVTDIDSNALSACPESWNTSTADSANSDHMAQLFEAIAHTWGGVDCVCANTGIAGPTAKLEDISPEDFMQCVTVNLNAAFLTAKNAAPIMKQQRSGSILFTSSTAGIHGFPNRSPYCASKWGTHGLMKTIAMELGPFGIRSNVICPGSVEGPRIEGVIEREAKTKGSTPEKIRAGYEEGTSMRSFVSSDDIANMAVFLASDAAKLVSGQVISVDGHIENPDPKV